MSTISMRSFKALVKREYWENKGSMFTTPAIMALVFVGFILLLSFTGGAVKINHGLASGMTIYEYLPAIVTEFENLDNKERSISVQMGLYAPLAIFGFVMFLISLFYSLGSLYDERRDKSILFWKSLPISDTATVLSKFFAVCLMIPALYFSVVVAFQLFILIYSTVMAWFGGSLGGMIWTSSNLFTVVFHTLFSLITASLWLAPLWGWLMLASSWAKRVAFLWGVLPILMISIAEAWVFRSSYFIEIVGERIAKASFIINSNMNYLLRGDMFDGSMFRWYEVFLDSEFWFGLVISGLFLVVAIYTRRFRNEA